MPEKSLLIRTGFTGGSVVKNPPVNAGDMSLIPELERSPGEENGNPLQYSCLGNPLWTEEPSGLQFMGFTKVGHNLAAKQEQSYSISVIFTAAALLKSIVRIKILLYIVLEPSGW